MKSIESNGIEFYVISGLEITKKSFHGLANGLARLLLASDSDLIENKVDAEDIGYLYGDMGLEYHGMEDLHDELIQAITDEINDYNEEDIVAEG